MQPFCFLSADPAAHGMSDRSMRNLGALQHGAFFCPLLNLMKPTPFCSIGIRLQLCSTPMGSRFQHGGMRCAMWNKNSPFARCLYLPRGEKTMATVVGLGEHDCNRAIPEQQHQCFLCKECLTNAHRHPGQWKWELQRFLLRYSDI